MAIISTVTPPSPDKGAEKLGHSYIAGRDAQRPEPLRKQAASY